MTYKLLKQAADHIDSLATQLEAAEKSVAEAQTKVAAAESKLSESVKTASETVKASEDQKAKLATMAKVAAERCLANGLVSSVENRDKLAAEILDHAAALDRLAKVAGLAKAPRLGTVVADDAKAPLTSEEVWANSVKAASAKFNLR